MATADKTENLPVFTRNFLRDCCLDGSINAVIESSGWFDLLVINIDWMNGWMFLINEMEHLKDLMGGLLSLMC